MAILWRQIFFFIYRYQLCGFTRFRRIKRVVSEADIFDQWDWVRQVSYDLEESPSCRSIESYATKLYTNKAVNIDRSYSQSLIQVEQSLNFYKNVISFCLKNKEVNLFDQSHQKSVFQILDLFLNLLRQASSTTNLLILNLPPSIKIISWLSIITSLSLNCLQFIRRIDFSFLVATEMRPKRELIFLVILLSAALCNNAELRLTDPNAQAEQSKEIEHTADPSKYTFNITFQQFKLIYHKKYSSIAEQNYRKLIFQQNLDELNRHNSNSKKKYRKKPNAFLDVSREEFKSVYTTVRPSDKFSRNVSAEITKKEEEHEKHSHRSHAELNETTNEENYSNNSQNQNTMVQNSAKEQTKTVYIHQTVRPLRRTVKNLQSENNLLSGVFQKKSVENSTAKSLDSISQSKLPSVKTTNLGSTQKININWSAYTGQVRYQGYCGACYAFATIDTFAAHLAIYQYDFFVSLSVQQVIDCSTNQLTYGCNGGYLEGALTYIQMNGIVTEGVYPFTSGTNGAANSCKMSGGSFKLSSFKPIEQGSCSDVISQLYRGPISAGISGYNLRFYDSGIFDDCSARDALDHAVMIMGFQSGKGWLIKNSWGNDWGEKGYGWIAEGNTCWICNMTVAIVI